MENIRVREIMETTFENGTCWVEYEVGNKIGYIISEEFEENEEKVVQGLIDSGNFDIEKLINKIDITTCSEKLYELVENCRQSENEMWFVEEGELSEEEIEKLEKEVDVLGINDYVTFYEDDTLVTVWGGAPEQFLFPKL